MAGPFSVEGATPGTQVWGVDAAGNTVQSGNLTVLGTVFTGAGSPGVFGTVTTTAATVTAGVITTGTVTTLNTATATVGLGGFNSSIAASATILSTLLIGNKGAAGTQIPDTTRDYMCYVTSIGGGAANTLVIGSTSTPGLGTISALGTYLTGSYQTFDFLLPAGWYVFFNGTGTLGNQTGIPL